MNKMDWEEFYARATPKKQKAMVSELLKESEEQSKDLVSFKDGNIRNVRWEDRNPAR